METWKLISSFLGGVVATLISLIPLLRVVPIAELLKRTIFTAKLRIEYRDVDRCVDIIKTDFNDGNGEIFRKYARLAVYNDDIQTAQNCRIVLQKIQEVVNDRLYDVPYKTPLRLLWARETGGENMKGVDIPKGGPMFVDLLYTANGKQGDFIVMRDCHHSKVLEFGKRYRFYLQGMASGMNPVEFVCDVIMKDRWEHFIVVSPDPLVIVSRKADAKLKNSDG